MDAIAFHGARKRDVVLLIEPRLQLNNDRHLLPCLGRCRQRADDGRIPRGAVERELDRQHLRIAGRRLQESLHRRAEGLVWVVHQHVAFTNHLKQIPPVTEWRWHDRRIGDVAQLGHIKTGNVQQVAKLEEVILIVHITRTQRSHQLRFTFRKLLQQQLPHRLRHVALHLQTHHLAKSPLKHLLFNGLQQILRLIDLPKIQIRVSRNAEREPPFYLHTRKQGTQVLTDHLLQRHVHMLARPINGYPARQRTRYLHARKMGLTTLGITDVHRQRQRQIRDVGKRMAGVYRQRRKHGEDLRLEVGVHAHALRLAERGHRHQLDAFGLKRRQHERVQRMMPPLQ